jgi:hypothetical protein
MPAGNESELTRIYTAQQIVCVMNRISEKLPIGKEECGQGRTL